MQTLPLEKQQHVVDKIIYVPGNQRSHTVGNWVINISRYYLTQIIEPLCLLQYLTILFTMIIDGNLVYFC